MFYYFYIPGDLTDAKTPDGEGSTQYEQEWISYKNVLYGADVPSKVLWLDIRGNHGACTKKNVSILYCGKSRSDIDETELFENSVSFFEQS